MFLQLRKYAKLAFIIIFVLSLLTAFFATKYAIKMSKENKRIETNFLNVYKTLDSTTTASGKKDYTINSLTLKKNELVQTNGKIVADLKDANIKIKNTKTITTIEYRYKFVNDSFYIAKKLNDTTFESTINNKWVSMSQRINLRNHGTTVGTDSLKIVLRDSLFIPYEKLTKGWWFWKKTVGVKVHVIAKNPYYQMDKLLSIDLTK